MLRKALSHSFRCFALRTVRFPLSKPFNFSKSYSICVTISSDLVSWSTECFERLSNAFAYSVMRSVSFSFVKEMLCSAWGCLSVMSSCLINRERLHPLLSCFLNWRSWHAKISTTDRIGSANQKIFSLLPTTSRQRDAGLLGDHPVESWVGDEGHSRKDLLERLGTNGGLEVLWRLPLRDIDKTELRLWV